MSILQSSWAYLLFLAHLFVCLFICFFFFEIFLNYLPTHRDNSVLAFLISVIYFSSLTLHWLELATFWIRSVKSGCPSFVSDLRGKTFSISLFNIVMTIVFCRSSLSISERFPLFLFFWEFYHEHVSNFVNCYFCIIVMIIWFSFFSLLIR